MPYFSSNKTRYAEESRKKQSNHFNNFVGNLLPPMQNWAGHDTEKRMDNLQRVKIQALCNGTVSKFNVKLEHFKLEKIDFCLFLLKMS